MILVDAGPLVALIHRDDRHHGTCTEALRALKEPLVTVWPAFTEAAYLLGFSWTAQDALWEFVSRGALGFLPLDEGDAPRMRELMGRYRDPRWISPTPRSSASPSGKGWTGSSPSTAGTSRSTGSKGGGAFTLIP